MGLNIKSDDVQRLARELADLTGESMTQAILKAVEDRLSKIRRERDVEERLRRVDEIIRRSGPTPPGATSDHSDLYDEDGLPA